MNVSVQRHGGLDAIAHPCTFFEKEIVLHAGRRMAVEDATHCTWLTFYFSLLPVRAMTARTPFDDVPAFTFIG